MSNLSTTEKQILEKAFNMQGGYVLNFSDRTMQEFFRDDLRIDIYDDKYNYSSGSKANRIRGFWLNETDEIVANSINKIVNYIESQILIGSLDRKDFPDNILIACREIAKKLIGEIEVIKTDYKVEAYFKNGDINIKLQDEIFDHVKKLLNDQHYYNAVEESYKIVREKLKKITGKEKAHEAFKEENYKTIFGHDATSDAEHDFFEGVKFLHMAIQNLRNEKAHTPAKEIDKNLAIHYISLASLAYDLI